METVELRTPAKKNRQSSSEVIEEHEPNSLINLMMQSSLDVYHQLIEGGVAKECARMVLPLGTQTTMYMNGTVRSWIHYIQLRTEENTQKEHRQVALEIKKVFIEQFPRISEALNWKKE